MRIKEKKVKSVKFNSIYLCIAVRSIIVSIEIGGSESGPLPTTPGQDALCNFG
jgi:hypothetical protein